MLVSGIVRGRGSGNLSLEPRTYSKTPNCTITSKYVSNKNRFLIISFVLCCDNTNATLPNLCLIE